MYSIYGCMRDALEEVKVDSGKVKELMQQIGEGNSLDTNNLLNEVANELVSQKVALFTEKVMKAHFEKFIDSTMDIWNNMTMGQILKVDKETIHDSLLNMFEYPFNIVYFFKQQGPEGTEYTFLDNDANKVYSDYKFA